MKNMKKILLVLGLVASTQAHAFGTPDESAFCSLAFAALGNEGMVKMIITASDDPALAQKKLGMTVQYMVTHQDNHQVVESLATRGREACERLGLTENLNRAIIRFNQARKMKEY